MIGGSKNVSKPQGRISSQRMMFMIFGGIIAAEIIATSVVRDHHSELYYLQVIVDVLVMSAIILPVLYFLVLRQFAERLRQREQSEAILQARLRLMEFSNNHSLQDLLRATLDELERLTDSSIGFFHFLEPDQVTLSLQVWSTQTLANFCSPNGTDTHYPLDRAGVWADAARQRVPVIHNDYKKLPNRKGLPAGHIDVQREIVIPVERDGKIMAVLGVGNKPHKYSAQDVEVASLFADFAWDVVLRKQAEEALRASEEKFRTLVDWTFDWEKWINPQGEIVYMSPSCKRITGYSVDEFFDQPNLLREIVHPDDLNAYDEHYQSVHDESIGVVNFEYRVLDREGNTHWIDHVCRPLFDGNGNYLGRRVSNRDVTEKKQAEDLFRQTVRSIQIDISRDLHDTLGQNLGYLRLKLDQLAGADMQKCPDFLTDLKSMSTAANESYDLIRGMLAVLQMDSSSDLLHFFAGYAAQIEERSNIRIRFASRGAPHPLSVNQIRQLFYAYREALSNIEKHSKASEANVSLEWRFSSLCIMISDDGRGIAPQDWQGGDHYGLKFMQERIKMLGGSLSVDTGGNGGTTITINVPYETGLLAVRMPLQQVEKQG